MYGSLGDMWISEGDAWISEVLYVVRPISWSVRQCMSQWNDVLVSGVAMHWFDG